jgi:hypothetical protein
MRAVTDPALLEQLEGATPAAGRKPVSDPDLLAALDEDKPDMGRFQVSTLETMEESPLGVAARAIRSRHANDPEVLARAYSRLSPAGQMEASRAREDLGVMPVPGGILSRRPIDQMQGPAREALMTDWERMNAAEQAAHQQRFAEGQAAEAEHQARVAGARQQIGPPQGALDWAQELGGMFVGSVAGDPTAMIGPAAVAGRGVRGAIREAGTSAATNVGASIPTLPVWAQGALERRGVSPEEALGEQGQSTGFAALFGAGVPVVGRIIGKVGAKLRKPPEQVTLQDVLANAEDPQIAPDVQEFIRQTGYTGDPFKAQAVLDQRRAVEADRVLQQPGPLAPRTRPEGARRALDREIDTLRMEREGVETGQIDPAAANIPQRPALLPEVIRVAPEGTPMAARTGRGEEDAIIESVRTLERRRLEEALRQAGVDEATVKQAFNYADLQARRGHVQADGPTERDLVLQERNAERARGAFRLAEKSREVKAANEVAQPPRGTMDVKPGGVPAGRQNRILVDVADGRPVQVLGQDAKGMFEVVEIDPRTGQEIGQPPFKAEAIKQVEYGGRLDQDFEVRSDTRGMAEKLRLPRATERIGEQRPLAAQREMSLLEPPPPPKAPEVKQNVNQPLPAPVREAPPQPPKTVVGTRYNEGRRSWEVTFDGRVPGDSRGFRSREQAEEYARHHFATHEDKELRFEQPIDEGDIRNPSPQDILQNVGPKPGGKPYGIVDELKAAGGLSRAAAQAEWGRSGLMEGAWDKGGRNALLQGRGMKLDRAVEWATERGYLPEGSTPNDLLEALERNDMLPEQSTLRNEQDQWSEARDAFVEEFRERQRAGETPAQIRASWARETEELAARAGVQDELFGERAEYDDDAVAGEPASGGREATFGEEPPFDTPVSQGARGADPFDSAPRSDASELPSERRPAAVEKTEQGDQYVVPGAEKKQSGLDLLGPKLRAEVEQKGVDGLELFDPDAPSPVRMPELFDILRNDEGAMDIARIGQSLRKDFIDMDAVKGLAASFRNAPSIWKRWRGFGADTFMSTDARLRALSNQYSSPTLWKLADMFHATAGLKYGTIKAKGDVVGRTYHEAVDRETGVRLAKMADLMKNFDGDEGADAKIWKYITDPRANKGQDKYAKAAKIISDMLADIWEYRASAGEDIGKITYGYFPRVPDLDAVRARPEEFKQAAAKVYSSIGAADPKASAEAWYNAILTDGMGLDQMELRDVSPFAVANASGKTREFGEIADKILGDFYVKDITSVMAGYVTGSIRRAEFVRRFGKKGRAGSAERRAWEKEHGGKTQWEVMRAQIIEEAKASGKNTEPLNSELRGLVQANLGTLGANVSRRARQFIGFAHVANQLGTLDQTLITSLTELSAGFMRTGSFAEGFRFFGRSLMEYAKALKGASPSEAREWAEGLGIVNDAIIEMMMQSRISGIIDSKGQQRLLAKFHKATTLHQFTEATRVASLGAGRRFIQHWAEQLAAGGKKGQRAEIYLKELGVEDPKAFAAWLKSQGGVPKLGDVMRGKDMAGVYSTALGRFVDQTIMKPTRAVKPKWASHPAGSLFYSLMSWAYAFRNNALGRQARLARMAVAEKNLGFLAPLVLGMPALVAMGMVNEQYVRPVVKGKAPPEDESDADFVLRIADRSGITSTFTPLVNALRGVRYRRSVGNTLLGPAIGRPVDALDTMLGLGPMNSPNTDTAERKALRKFYQVVAEPALDALSLTLLGPALRTPAVVYTGRKTDEDAFVDGAADLLGLKGGKAKRGTRQGRETRATR